MSLLVCIHTGSEASACPLYESYDSKSRRPSFWREESGSREDAEDSNSSRA